MPLIEPADAGRTTPVKKSKAARANFAEAFIVPRSSHPAKSPALCGVLRPKCTVITKYVKDDNYCSSCRDLRRHAVEVLQRGVAWICGLLRKTRDLGLSRFQPRQPCLPSGTKHDRPEARDSS